MPILYISYDGLMEPLGQSQVLSYLRKLAVRRSITLVTYEKPSDLNDAGRRENLRGITTAAGIHWIPLTYHRRPRALATAYDIFVGLLLCMYVCATRRIRIVHTRSYIPAFFALVLRRIFRVKFIFDMRGFWIDGHVESGSLREDSSFVRVARRLEARFVQEADVIIALTAGAVEVMTAWRALQVRPARFAVIPTCADLDVFRPPPSGRRASDDSPVTFGYVGNAGRGYFIDPVIDLYLAARKLEPDTRLRIVNRNDHGAIRASLDARGLRGDSVQLVSSNYLDVPKNIWQMDVGVFPVFHPNRSGQPTINGTVIDGIAAIGNVPTRMGEFLACGVPCVAYGARGSAVDLLEQEGVGHVLRTLDPEALSKAAAAALSMARQDGLSARCVETARRHLSLDAGVAAYEGIYASLEAGARPTT